MMHQLHFIAIQLQNHSIPPLIFQATCRSALDLTPRSFQYLKHLFNEEVYPFGFQIEKSYLPSFYSSTHHYDVNRPN